MRKLKTIVTWVQRLCVVAVIIIVALFANGKLDKTVIQREVISHKEARITELKESEQGQKVLQLWAEEQYALEQKAEAESTLEKVRAESLSLE